MVELAQWLASLPLSQAVRKMAWLIPWLQTVHILANAMILGAVIMIDLRIWGFSRSQTVVERARRFQPWIWAGLVVLTVTGIVLLLVAPRRTLTDVAFQAKMVMMAIAIAATLVLQVALRPNGVAWDGDSGWRRLASAFAVFTLVLWIGATLAGRGRWLGLMLTR
jgi:hypothetical protein